MKAHFMGLGYIGLPTAIVVAKHGVKIAGVDINAQVVEATNQGKLHIIEPGTEDMLLEVLTFGHLEVYTEPQVSDACFMAVPTPFKGDHGPDVSFVESATHTVLPLLKEGDLHVVEPISPVGTIGRMANLIFSERPELKGKIYITYCPERVLPDNVTHELVHNGRVIDDTDEASARKMMEFHGQLVEGTLHPTNSKTIETCKLTENSSRDAQIVFASELSFICDEMGINVWELTDLANRHSCVSILQSGCGVGGHCIAVDPYFITAEFPMEGRTVSMAHETNNCRVSQHAEKVRSAMLWFKLKCGRKPAVATMGSAFEPGIDNLHKSPARGITAKVLQSCGNADITVMEPNVSEHKLFKLTPYKEVYEKADIVILLVNHREFSGLNHRDDVEILDFCGTFKK